MSSSLSKKRNFGRARDTDVRKSNRHSSSKKARLNGTSSLSSSVDSLSQPSSVSVPDSELLSLQSWISHSRDSIRLRLVHNEDEVLTAEELQSMSPDEWLSCVKSESPSSKSGRSSLSSSTKTSKRNKRGHSSSSSQSRDSHPISAATMKNQRDNNDKSPPSNGFFVPSYTHQIFPAERIHGFKRLRIGIFLSQPELHIYACISYADRRANNATDIESILRKWIRSSIALTFDRSHFMRVAFSLSRNDVECSSPSDSSSDHSTEVFPHFPPGRLHCEYWRSDDSERVFEIRVASLSDPWMAEFHARLEFLVLLFIESSSFIDKCDEVWQVMALFERCNHKKSKPTLRVVGYLTVYSFYAFPNARRLRVSQVLILPPFQRQGHGLQLMLQVHLMAYYGHTIDQGYPYIELNVEDPAAGYQLLRDVCDCYLASLCMDELVESLLFGSEDENSSDSDSSRDHSSDECSDHSSCSSDSGESSSDEGSDNSSLESKRTSRRGRSARRTRNNARRRGGSKNNSRNTRKNKSTGKKTRKKATKKKAKKTKSNGEGRSKSESSSSMRPITLEFPSQKCGSMAWMRIPTMRKLELHTPRDKLPPSIYNSRILRLAEILRITPEQSRKVFEFLWFEKLVNAGVDDDDPEWTDFRLSVKRRLLKLVQDTEGLSSYDDYALKSRLHNLFLEERERMELVLRKKNVLLRLSKAKKKTKLGVATKHRYPQWLSEALEGRTDLSALILASAESTSLSQE